MIEPDPPQQPAHLQSAQDTSLRFLAMLGHEIKAPLNAVTGFAEIMLLGKAELPDQYHTYLADILASGRQVLDVIDRVLTMVRLETKQYPLQPVLIDVTEITRQSWRALEPSARAAGIELAASLPDHLTGFADATAMRQVLTNILTNAIKYSPSGAKVRINLSSTPQKIQWRIEDQGSGIAPHDLARIFMPFERAVQANRPMLDGLGLGLPIAKALIEQMGGALNLTSRLGQGTIVIIDLPADRMRASASSPEST